MLPLFRLLPVPAATRAGHCYPCQELQPVLVVGGDHEIGEDAGDRNVEPYRHCVFCDASVV